MKRSVLNMVVDALAFAGFVLVASTGLLMKVVLPPGSGRLVGEGTGPGAAGKTVTLLWGLTRQGWGEVHFWISVVLLAVLSIHVVLHWSWIVCMLKGRPKEGSGGRFVLGAFALALLSSAAVAPFFSSARKATRAELARESGAPLEARKEAKTIRGSMTLAEAAKALGTTTEGLKARLRLPPVTPDDEKLGRLKLRYGFEMEDLRDKK
jgi:hypothetical protein